MPGLLPIKENRLFLPRARPADHVHVQMVHLLPALFPGIDLHPKAPGRIGVAALLRRQLGGKGEDAAQQSGIGWLGVRQRSDVALRDDQKMHRGPRGDVVKGQQLFVFIHFAAGDVARSDFAKDAIVIVGMA